MAITRRIGSPPSAANTKRVVASAGIDVTTRVGEAPEINIRDRIGETPIAYHLPRIHHYLELEDGGFLLLEGDQQESGTDFLVLNGDARNVASAHTVRVSL